MALGNTNMILAERQTLRDGDVEISERAYNLVIGGMLLWGFLLNYITVTFFGAQVVRLVSGMNPLVFLIGYFVIVLLGNTLVVRSGPALSFVGYTLIAAPIGLVLCMALQGYGTGIIREAVLVTAIVTLSFMIAATVFPGFFLRLGRVLFFSLIAMIVGELIAMLIFHSAPVIYEWIGVGIFSLYIGYDWARANSIARTLDNAIDISASLYLDIINLFLRILSIMARSKRRN